MIQIYHNPRCSKSREGLAIVEASGKDFEIIHYMKEPPEAEDLKKVILTLKMNPIDLVRKNEPIWKEIYEDKFLNDQQIIAAMVLHPQLIERPIVINGENAVIGRPPELIKDIL
ncbi:MAG: arsenate reductase (glutaredoxin) [Moheibacter sp.]